MPLLSSLASAASYLGIQLPWMVATISGTSTSSSIGNFRTVTFRGNGSFVIQGLSSISSRNRARVIIAAGGGAGHSSGGGGGGGGLLRNEAYTFTSPTTFTVTIGGAAGNSSSGNNTSFGSITAYGGGTGGSSGGSGGGYNGPAFTCTPGNPWEGPSGPGGFPGQNHGSPDINTIVSGPFIGSGIGSQYGMTGGSGRSHGSCWGGGRNKGAGGGGTAGITTARITPGNPTGGHNGHGGSAFYGPEGGGNGGNGGTAHRYTDSTFGIDYHIGHGGGGAGGGDGNGETGGGSGSGYGGNGSGQNRNGCPYTPCNSSPFAPGCFAAAGPGIPGNPSPTTFGNGGGGAGASAGGHCEGDECGPCGPSVQATLGGGGSGGVVILKYQYQGS